MARKFLYIVATLIVLAVAGLFVFRIWGNQLIRFAMIPTEAFHAEAPIAAARYSEPGMWIARPDIAHNPARWTPPGYAPRRTHGGAAIFFVHPTSYLTARGHWNASLDDADTNERAALFVRAQASVFNDAGEIWVPRYRQAAFGAFLTNAGESGRALDLAYGDVLAAFDSFLKQVDPARPIILAGHSQGALHLTRLLRERIAGTPVARRIVAAYVVGWPVSADTDLAALGMPECTGAAQTGCLLSWETFAAPADPSLILEKYDQTIGFDGRPRRGTRLVCTNPISGTAGSAAPASANLGTLFPAKDLNSAVIQPGAVPAACQGRGFLMIGAAPDVGNYVLPGNNYHVYDYSLFWANVRADAARRLAAFVAR